MMDILMTHSTSWNYIEFTLLSVSIMVMIMGSLVGAITTLQSSNMRELSNFNSIPYSFSGTNFITIGWISSILFITFFLIFFPFRIIFSVPLGIKFSFFAFIISFLRFYTGLRFLPFSLSFFILFRGFVLPSIFSTSFGLPEFSMNFDISKVMLWI
jgi:hypothetical protein